MRFKKAKEIILLQEMLAHKVPLAALGSVQKNFDLAAQSKNENPNLRVNVKDRIVQEKFNKFLATFRKENDRGRKRSGEAGKLSETDELMASMLEIFENVRETEANEKKKLKRAEMQKM